MTLKYNYRSSLQKGRILHVYFILLKSVNFTDLNVKFAYSCVKITD